MKTYSYTRKCKVEVIIYKIDWWDNLKCTLTEIIFYMLFYII